MDNLVSLLERNAAGEHGILFIESSESESFLSYAELLMEAKRLTASLYGHGVKPGEEVVLQLESNRSLIICFWACIIGKIIPVPLARGNQEDHRMKFVKVWQTLKRPYLITDQAHLEKLQNYAEKEGFSTLADDLSHSRLPFESDTVLTHDFETPEIDLSDIAYIQYSSGSTGDPKGVVLTHENLLFNTADIVAQSAITSTDKLLSWMPLTHDMGMICWFLSGVYANASLYLLPTNLFIRRPLLWLTKATAHQATHLYSPNFGYQYLLNAFDESQDYSIDLNSVKLIYNGAEPISLSLCQAFLKTLNSYGLHEKAIHPGYGLAEASVAVTLQDPNTGIISHCVDRTQLVIGKEVAYVPHESEEAIPFVEVGYPIPHCEVRIADDLDQACPTETIGHIQIRGKNVTAGYYSNETATSELFTNEGWLRTGDVGFFKEDRLIVTGRYKNLIIKDGQNYYPHDIEQVVHQLPEISTGMVVACGIRQGQSVSDDLIVFVLFKKSAQKFWPLAKEIKSLVLQVIGLEAAAVVPVRKIPKTTSGKVQHHKLKWQFEQGHFLEVTNELSMLQEQASESLLTGNVDEQLLKIYEELFGESSVDFSDFNLFRELSSLQLIQFKVRVESHFHVRLDLQELFDSHSIRDLIPILEQKSSREINRINPVPKAYYPTTAQQKRIWVLDQQDETGRYNIALSFDCEGTLDLERLTCACQQLIQRHHGLRTRFHLEEGELVQSILSMDEINFEIRQVKESPNNMPSTPTLEAWVNAPFNFKEDLLFKVCILRQREETEQVLILMHHLIADGWSADLLVRELARNYEFQDETDQLPPLDFQFVDFVDHQQQQENSDNHSATQHYWLEEFKTQPGPIDFRKHEWAISDSQGNNLYFEFSEAQIQQLNSLSVELGGTLFMSLFSVINILLYKHSMQQDLVVGTDLAGRDRLDLEDKVGLFTKTMALRVKLEKEKGFRSLFELVRKKLLMAERHQAYDYDRLIGDLSLHGEQLFNVLVLFQNFNFPEHLKVGETTWNHTIPRIQSSLSSIDFEFIQYGERVGLHIRYDQQLFTRRQVERLQPQLSFIIQQACLNPDLPLAAYDIIGGAELEGLTMASGTSVAIDQKIMSVVETFEQSVSKYPRAIAVEFAETTLTYQDLNKRSNALAHWLIRYHNIKKEGRVGLHLTRSPELVIALLAVLKTGAAYIPLDPENPTSRILYMSEQGSAQLVLSANPKELEDDLFSPIVSVHSALDQSKDESVDNPTICISENDLAYLMYTSGTSGRPKGVMVEHRSLADYVHTFSEYFELTNADKVIQQSSISFDTMVEEVYPTLCQGGTVVVANKGGRHVEELVNLIERTESTLLSTTPHVLNELNKLPVERLDSLRLIISGGDLLKAAYVDQLIRQIPIVNSYGPTESTVCVTYQPVDIRHAEIIGRPLPNRNVFILDEDLNPCPIGVVGELYLGGEGLARGYANDPAETSRVFLTDRKGRRIYKTGDIGRFREDHSIEMLGRKDQQIKVRGYRVEPEEVEKTLRSLTQMDDLLVTSYTDQHENIHLVAYYTGEARPPLTFKKVLDGVLPDYMIPEYFVHLEEMPLNTNLKVDKSQLPSPETLIETESGPTDWSPIHHDLATIWKKILKVTEVDLGDSFVQLGGNSIKAVQIAAKIQQKLKLELDFTDLFRYATVAQLGHYLGQKQTGEEQPIPLADEQNQYPLSHAQQRLWILEQFEENELAYVLPFAFELVGEFNEDAFQEAVSKLIERHEVLRTGFIMSDGLPGQRVFDVSELDVQVEIEDLTDINLSEEDLNDRIKRIAQVGFDLERPPLFRVNLLHVKPATYVVVVAIHHIISDGWSMNVLARDLVALYNALEKGTSQDLPTLRIQHKDYVSWQFEQLTEDHLDTMRSYWQHQLGGEIPVIDLSKIKSRPARQTYHGQRKLVTIPGELQQSLLAEARSHDTTLFVLFLAAVKALIYKYTSQQDIIVGTPISLRDHVDLEDQVGNFLNTLPLRTSFNPNQAFSSLVRQVKETMTGAFQHAQYPFDLIVEGLDLTRDMSRSTLFDIMVGYQKVQDAFEEMNALNELSSRMRSIDPGISQFDLSIDFFEKEDLELVLEFNTDLFSASFMDRFASQLIHLMQQVCINPSVSVASLPYLPELEQSKIEAFSLTGQLPEALPYFPSLFQACVVASPHATALIYEGREFTYEELDILSNRLANYLVLEQQVKPNELVGLMVDRSEWMVILVLAVIKSGAAFTPIDANYPIDRINHIIHSSKLKLLITDQSEQAFERVESFHVIELEELIQAIKRQPDVYTVPDLRGSDLIYAIYTSGSQGKPKGVAVSHANVAAVAEAWLQTYHLREFQVRLLQLASFSFDVCFGDICRGLLSGGTIVICPEATRIDFPGLYGLIEQHQINIFESTPALINPFFEYIHDARLDVSFMKLLIVGSDTFYRSDFETLQKRFGHQFRMINSYGVTEATIDSSFYEGGIENFSSHTVPIGRPLPGVEYQVLDLQEQPVGIGIAGELYIGGPAVALGYLNNKPLTQASFISRQGNRYYRTGDLCCWQEDGNLIYIRRNDTQVKIRGFRIEIGEVENALLGHESIQEVAVLIETPEEGAPQLIAYYVSDTKEIGCVIKDHITATLPAYMIPNRLLRVAHIPLSNNGKINRGALINTEILEDTSASEFVEAKTALEKDLAALWCELLKVERVGTNDNFFELGGNSLKAAQLSYQLSSRTGIKIELADFFLQPTIKKLVELVQGNEEQGVAPIPVAEKREYYPVSDAQRRMWILQEQVEDMSAYNMPAAYRFSGNFQPETYQKAINAVIKQFSILRTVFPLIEGTPVQSIQPYHEDFLTLPVKKDSRPLEVILEEKMHQEQHYRFDLENGPLMRATLIKLVTGEWLFIFNIHHIIFDGWSAEVLFHEIARHYNALSGGEVQDRPPVHIDYKDFTLWQKDRLLAGSNEHLEAYWVRQLDEVAEPLQLPYDRPRTAMKSYKGTKRKYQLNARAYHALHTLIKQQGTSAFSVLLSVLKVLFYRYTGQEDIIIGTASAGRNHPALETQIGYFINTLALRTLLTGKDSFSDVLKQVQQTISGALKHQEYPFEQLLDKLGIERSTTHAPLFDVMVVMQDEGVFEHGKELHEVTVNPCDFAYELNKFDLLFNFNATEDAYQVDLEFNTDLFDCSTIDRLFSHFENLLISVAAAPSEQLVEFEYLDKNEKQQLLQEFNQTPSPEIQFTSVVQWFEAQCIVKSDLPALRFGETTYTYREFNQKVNQLAHYLIREHQVMPNDIVAIMMPPCDWTIISVFAILKAGGAYMPIDPTFPLDRKQYMANEADPKLVLSMDPATSHELENHLFVSLEEITWAHYPDQNPGIPVSNDHLAYVLFTSGTTGRPKGVLIEHRGLLNFCQWLSDLVYSSRQACNALLTASVNFDASVQQLIPPFLNGGCLSVIPSEVKQNPELYFQTLVDHDIHIIDVTPTYLDLILNEAALADQKPDLRFTLIGGEDLPNRTIKRYQEVFGLESRLINVYGVTEATVESTYKEIYGQMEVRQSSVGKPINNAEIFILDEAKKPLPIGVPGELYIGGPGVARGYLNRDDLTAERFIHHPFGKSGRLYNTGDLCKWTENGEVIFLGRKDAQIKVRGHRVELTEISIALQQLPDIEHAVVHVWKDETGTSKLIAFYTAVPKELNATSVRADLSQILPGYMIPDHFVRVEHFQYNRNGKIDTKAMMRQVGDLQRSDQRKVRATNKLERALCRIWEEVLNVEEVGIEDNFFEMGGNSLKAMQILAKVRNELQAKVDLRMIFANPTIVDLANQIETNSGTLFPAIESIPDQIYYPLSKGQERLWILDQIRENRFSYQIRSSFDIQGALDVEALKSAFEILIERHEILRTTFDYLGQAPVQIVHEHGILDFNYIKPSLKSQDIPTFADGRFTFDLKEGPLLKIHLTAMGSGHRLDCNVHHIISDGWSAEVIMSEVGTLYNGIVERSKKRLPRLSIQYRDYAHWQHAILSSEFTRNQRDFWIDRLGGELPKLDMPLDYPRPAVRSTNGNLLSRPLGEALLGSVKSVCTDWNTTPFAFFHAILHTLLYKYTGQNDLIIGTPVANRDLPELENQIGFYANTLALRMQNSPELVFSDLLLRSGQVIAESLDHQHYPFDELVNELNLPKDTSRTPLFDVFLTVEDVDEANQEYFEGLQVSPIPLKETSTKFDLEFNFKLGGSSGLHITIIYNTTIFSEDRVNGMITHLENLTHQVVKNPSGSILDLELPDAKEQQLLKTFNNTEFDHEQSTVIELFERQASLCPDAIAVVYEDVELTYDQLNTQSNRVAQYLRKELEVINGELIGIMLDRSTDMIVAILGILKAGGVYVPIDPAYPKERKKFIMEESNLKALCLQEEYLTDAFCDQYFLIQSKEVERSTGQQLSVEVSPEDPIYAIYTSGTTGMPKASLNIHEAVSNLSQWLASSLLRNEEIERVLLTASFGFDSSVKLIFPTLISGKTLYILHDRLKQDPESLLRLVAQEYIDVMDSTPAFLKVLLQHAQDADIRLPLKYLVTGGEVLSNQVVHQYFQVTDPYAKLVNVYGLTEAAVDSTVELIGSTDRKEGSIGKPIDNVRIYLLDSYGKLVPIGVNGEIYIAGAGLSAGYLNQPELTQDRFVKIEGIEEPLLYRTGDIGRWEPDGTLTFKGRRDRQVKIRGYRIELEEIEQTLLSIKTISQAYTNIFIDESGEKQLALYYISEDIDAKEARRWLDKNLPNYAIPAYVVPVEKLPLTVNGKIDHKKLPDPRVGLLKRKEEIMQPTNETEETLLALWQSILSITLISVDDNFFEIGGNSLKVITLFKELEEKFPGKIQVHEIFNNPTIRQLAELISTEMPELSANPISEVEF